MLYVKEINNRIQPDIDINDIKTISSSGLGKTFIKENLISFFSENSKFIIQKGFELKKEVRDPILNWVQIQNTLKKYIEPYAEVGFAKFLESFYSKKSNIILEKTKASVRVNQKSQKQYSQGYNIYNGILKKESIENYDTTENRRIALNKYLNPKSQGLYKIQYVPNSDPLERVLIVTRVRDNRAITLPDTNEQLTRLDIKTNTLGINNINLLICWYEISDILMDIGVDGINSYFFVSFFFSVYIKDGLADNLFKLAAYFMWKKFVQTN